MTPHTIYTLVLSIDREKITFYGFFENSLVAAKLTVLRDEKTRLLTTQYTKCTTTMYISYTHNQLRPVSLLNYNTEHILAVYSHYINTKYIVFI